MTHSLLMVCLLMLCEMSFALSENEKLLLDKYLVGKRIVFLGEPDHWITDKVDYQISLLDYLISKGFTTIGNERGYTDSQFVHSFIKTGDKRFLEKNAEWGHRGPAWPKRNMMKGTLSIVEEFGNSYIKGMRENDWRLFSFLRDKNTHSQIQYFGYDVDKIPDIVFDQIQPFVEILDSVKDEAQVHMESHLVRSKTGDFREEARRLKLARDLVDKLNLMGIFGNKADSFQNILFQLEESVRFASVVYYDPSNQALMTAYEEREKTMFRIVDKLLSHPDIKIVLLGHNAHLPLDHVEYRRVYNVNGKELEVPGWLTLGSYLTKRYSNQTLAIWMLYDRGLHSAPFCKVDFPCEVKSLPNTIEAWMSQRFDRPLLLESTLVETISNKWIWRENGINQVTGNIQSVVDLIYFKKEVSGLPL